MLPGDSCYLVVHVTWWFMLPGGSCYLVVHVTWWFMLPGGSCYLHPHVMYTCIGKEKQRCISLMGPEVHLVASFQHQLFAFAGVIISHHLSPVSILLCRPSLQFLPAWMTSPPQFNKICHPSQRPRWQVDKETIGLSRVQ